MSLSPILQSLVTRKPGTETVTFVRQNEQELLAAIRQEFPEYTTWRTHKSLVMAVRTKYRHTLDQLTAQSLHEKLKGTEKPFRTMGENKNRPTTITTSTGHVTFNTKESNRY